MIFRVGEVVPINSMDRKVVYYLKNPLNFRPIKIFPKETTLVSEAQPQPVNVPVNTDNLPLIKTNVP
jgi:hypothetical protein